MPLSYTNPVYPYQRSPDQGAAVRAHHPVIIVGGGLAGLSAAIGLALQQVAAVVLDDNNTVSVGSRAICFAQRTLEICDRYGIGERMVDKGVTWQHGKVYWRDRLVYDFDLLPEAQHKMPAFINLQQYYYEQYLVERCHELSAVDLRWLNKAAKIEQDDDRVYLTVDTPDGEYTLSCDYLIAADGAGSGIRQAFNLPFEGQVFNDRFLIVDVIFKHPLPAERRFWFDAAFHPNQSTLLHKQPDNVWRIDFQLDADADPDEEKKAHNIIPRVRSMLGDDIEFELDWASVYTFRCRMMARLVHGRVIFAGDAAHQVSPFGARGGNGAIQAVDNLCWKLAAVIHAAAPPSLLDSYHCERVQGARENLLHSARATDFMSPKNAVSKAFQTAVLELAGRYPFARALVNSGRLSMPCVYVDSPLNSADQAPFAAAMRPGSACCDADIRIAGQPGWLLNQLTGEFVCLICDADAAAVRALLRRCRGLRCVVLGDAPDGDRVTRIDDPGGTLRDRYDLHAGGVYLIRPDQHVCARWRALDAGAVEAAWRRAKGQS